MDDKQKMSKSIPQQKKTLLFETDWLASKPFFYNLKNGLASSNINNIINYNTSINFHPEGLQNYLDYGYSVFGQTPLENLKFLPPSSRLFRQQDGKLVVEQMNDPVEKWIDYSLSENDIIDLIQERVQKWEKKLASNQEIILPLSGGFDSRLLLWCLRDKSRVRAFTYGISNNQDQSIEIVHARALAKHFSLNWKQITLGEYHNYFNIWDQEFGISTHAHGMYHIEFYNKIKENLNGNLPFLSGIVGDVWAGSILSLEIKNKEDLIKLGYTHGICANSKFLKTKKKSKITQQFFNLNNKKLLDNRFQIITVIRLKIFLLSYLMRIPNLFNFKPWSPFLDIDIATSMINLPESRRINRQWQRDFFKKVGLNLEDQKLKSNRRNTLNLQAMKNVRLNPLNVKLLSNIFEKSYVEWINKNIIANPLGEFCSLFLSIPKMGGVLRRLGIKDTNLEAYYAYLCLKPIESLLKKFL
jgi:hypothetical protein